MNYTSFAIRHSLSISAAVALPTLFEKAASEMDMTIQQMIIVAHVNDKVGAYMAELAEEVAEKWEADNGVTLYEFVAEKESH